MKAPEHDEMVFLEMRSPPRLPLRPPPEEDVLVRHVAAPTERFYRYLYDGVGEPWSWTRRRSLSGEQLLRLVHDPRIEIQVLYAQGVPAGFAELDLRRPPEIELVYFGLLPEFIGRGLGAFFLEQCLHQIWRHRPQRVWLHTRALDHPRARGNYERAGFVLMDREPLSPPLE